MKKKILVIAIVSCILVLSIAGSSIAYFTDVEKATNVFTTGDVNITLSEINPQDGQLTVVTDPDTKYEYTNIYPGQKVAKQPTITNVSESGDSVYAGAIITLTNATTLLKDANAVKAFLEGGAINTDGFATTSIAFDASTKTITVYVIINSSIPEDASVDIFTNVAVPAAWGNDDMDTFATMQISVNAYATQTYGFADAETAITTAFANRGWAGYSNAVAIPTVTP